MMMKEVEAYINILKNANIFNNIPEDKYPGVFKCLNASIAVFPQGAPVISPGNTVGCSGILLEGLLEGYLVDENGNQVTINHIYSGELLGAELACAGQFLNQVYVRAVEVSRVLRLDLGALLSEKTFSCPHRMQVTTNLMQGFARQVVAINTKMRILSQKKLRDKVKIYFQTLPISSGGVIILPFNRRELAEYLGADRSALSRELCKMRDEGVLAFSGARIMILDKNYLME